MTSISDKLSASVRKAKAQTSEEAKPAETAARPAAKAAPKRVAASSPARRAPAKSAGKPASSAKPSSPKASQDELFPTRVWPD